MGQCGWEWQLLTDTFDAAGFSGRWEPEQQLAPAWRKSVSVGFMESSLERFSSVRWALGRISVSVGFMESGITDTQSWLMGEYRYPSYWSDICQLIAGQEEESTGRISVSDGERFSSVRLNMRECLYVSDCLEIELIGLDRCQLRILRVQLLR